MNHHDTRFACCGASKWTTIIALLQIAGTVFLIMRVATTLKRKDDVSGDDSVIGDAKETIRTLLLVVAIIYLITGILLLIGNLQKRIRLLGTWAIVAVIVIILTDGIYIVLSVIAESPKILLPIILPTLVNILAIRVVDRRIQDIKFGLDGSDDKDRLV